MKTPRITQILLVLATLAISPAAHALFVNPGAGDVILGTGDDAVFPVGALPAGFTYFGAVPPANLRASTNGNLNFAGSTAFNDVGFPTAVGGGMIAPFWDDLNFSGAGSGPFLLNNTVPGQLTVIWSGVPAFGTTTFNTFEAVLFGTGNARGFLPGTIVLSYGNLGGLADANATIGLMSPDGTNFVTHAPLVGGGTNGVISATSLSMLSNKDFIFTPVGNTYAVAVLIPEPSTYALAIAGLGLLGCMQRFRSSRKV
ncbi:MAG: PEP-CTERM sorting domain-containing protein [Verrucomicrobiota bacterium]|nr:PEP-CTERM sorting domain-containing protein [Verrucomicrobiota bacterium]